MSLYDEFQWRGMLHEATPDLQKILAMHDMKEREAQLGYRFIGGTPAEFATFLKAEIAKWDGQAKKGSFKTN